MAIRLNTASGIKYVIKNSTTLSCGVLKPEDTYSMAGVSEGILAGIKDGFEVEVRSAEVGTKAVGRKVRGSLVAGWVVTASGVGARLEGSDVTGEPDGDEEGRVEGCSDGNEEGRVKGCSDGDEEGRVEGCSDGNEEGGATGCSVIMGEKLEGWAVGVAVGAFIYPNSYYRIGSDKQRR
jgi:hypothetical protein